MDTLPQISLSLPEMPRFDDGMVDMRELIRSMAESLINEIMSEQADIMCEEQDKPFAGLSSTGGQIRQRRSYSACKSSTIQTVTRQDSAARLTKTYA